MISFNCHYDKNLTRQKSNLDKNLTRQKSQIKILNFSKFSNFEVNFDWLIIKNQRYINLAELC